MTWFKRIFAPAEPAATPVLPDWITPAQLEALCPGQGIWAPLLSAAMDRFAITTPLRQAHWLAQVAHESALLTRTEESLNYRTAQRIQAVWPRRFATEAEAAPFVANPEGLAERVYGGRADLGNIRPGDGWRFRGGGLIQITGRRNFEALGAAFGISAEEAATWVRGRDGAALSAAWWWKTRGLNEAADRGGAEQVEAISIAVNGGRNGLAHRQALYAQAAKVMGASPFR